MTKFALPVLVLCILALFSYSVSSQSNDATPDLSALRAELTQKLAGAEKASQDREQQLVKTIDGVRAELQRLSADDKANSDKIAQTVMLRSDLLKLIQDAKSSSDKAAQIMLDQIDALRSDQVKFLKDAKATGDTAALALRQEIAASQAKLLAQVGDTVKAATAPNEALAQRVDAIKKDIDEVKRNLDEDQQNSSNISPGFALVVALVALVLGPFLAYRLTANQLAGVKEHAAAAAAQPQAAKTAEADQSAEAEPAPAAMAGPQQDDFFNHEAPPLGEEESPNHDANAHEQAEPDPEKV